MKISYNWLQQYIETSVPVEKICEILTDTGLEVEGLEKIESIKGGLEGLVIGHVLEKEKHPDADRLNVTKVDIGTEEVLSIVCGAPNVDAGQKVLIATVGCTLYPNDGESFKIKKSKIRGIPSFGMICAEDEVGLGQSHDGIMVLEETAIPGTLAREYFKLEDDYLIEIGLTPNRTDAMSHIGVARDLLAALKHQGKAPQEQTINWPNVNSFSVENTSLPIEIEVKDYEACPRYAGVSISNIKIEASPEWLQNRLRCIGLSPINNVVDITNYVNHEVGQPLHAFDISKITGNKVVVQSLSKDTPFTTLDGVERKLDENDLMICNNTEGMCIAGVFGGEKSGVSETTTEIFLESAYFNPVSVRKTAKRHGLNTDASFRFERGIDPNTTVYALKRAALLIKEIAGGVISSEITDLYPTAIEDFTVELTFTHCDRLIGKAIPPGEIRNILKSLDIKILSEEGDQLKLSVPAYRADVKRNVDIIEEIIRIYGFNEIDLPEKLNTSLSYGIQPNPEKVQNIIADLLASNGFNEAMSNSLTKSTYIEWADTNQLKSEHNVTMLNPLSSDLDVMRQSLLFNGLEAIVHNQNRQQENSKLFEFGKIYQKFDTNYFENKRLAIFLSGSRKSEIWNSPSEDANFFHIKSFFEAIIKRLGLNKNVSVSSTSNELFSDGLEYKIAKQKVANIGIIKTSLQKKFDIKRPVFCADIDWDKIIELLKMNKIKYKEISKFPEVRRDLSLLVNESISFQEIQAIASSTERKLLKEVNLFDVYSGKGIEQGKKSYAVSFTLQDSEKTLNDQQIDKVMQKIQKNLEQKLEAQLR